MVRIVHNIIAIQQMVDGACQLRIHFENDRARPCGRINIMPDKLAIFCADSTLEMYFLEEFINIAESPLRFFQEKRQGKKHCIPDC